MSPRVYVIMFAISLTFLSGSAGRYKTWVAQISAAECQFIMHVKHYHWWWYTNACLKRTCRLNTVTQSRSNLLPNTNVVKF